MSSLQQIKRRIKTSHSTVKITKVMQMISTSKLQKMKSIIINSKIYNDNVFDILSNLLYKTKVQSVFNKTENKKAIVITISSDKGLCGILNNRLCRHTIENIKILQEKGYSISMKHIGNKANSTFLHKLKDETIVQNYIDNFYIHGRINFVNLDILITNLITESEEFGDIFIAFNSFKSVMVNEFSFINIKDFISTKTVKDQEYKIDCNISEAIKFADYQALYAVLCYAINSNIICEHSLRMQAMDSATRNTEKIIDQLTTHYNKTRQAGITNSLIDVVSGSQSVN
jgi:F-type H+-transporting ATPase subunit gamma